VLISIATGGTVKAAKEAGKIGKIAKTAAEIAKKEEAAANAIKATDASGGERREIHKAKGRCSAGNN